MWEVLKPDGRFCPECCHKQAYACDHDGCGKTFAHVGPFEVHKRSHTGEKPFACDYVGCSALCNTSSDLTVHKREDGVSTASR